MEALMSALETIGLFNTLWEASPPRRFKNEYEYVDWAFYIINQNGYLKHHAYRPFSKDGNKSDLLSVVARNTGNTLFASQNPEQLMDVCGFYNESITFASPGSRELSFGYGNRSAVLFKMKYFKECIEDIDRALALNYPPELSEKLQQRKARAQALLPTQRELPFQAHVPKIKSKNALLPGASLSIRMVKNQEFGCHIVATKDISPGHTLLVEKPAYQGLTKQCSTYCSECLEVCLNMIPCEKCDGVLYCSTICKRQAYIEYHRYECVLIRYLGFEGFDWVAIRITLKRTKELALPHATDDDKIFEKCSKLFTGSAITNQELVVDAFTAAKVLYILKKHTDFFIEFDVEDKENALKTMLLHDQRLVRFNATLNSFHPVLSSAAGKAIYPTLSRFNHACDENVLLIFYGSTVVAKAKKKIKAGDQCFINYNIPNAEMFNSTEIRRGKLKCQYGFECKCRACEEQWPKEEDMKLSAAFLLVELDNIREEIETFTTVGQRKQDLIKKSSKIVQQLERDAPYTAYRITVALYYKLFSNGSNLDVLFRTIVDLVRSRN